MEGPIPAGIVHRAVRIPRPPLRAFLQLPLTPGPAPGAAGLRGPQLCSANTPCSWRAEGALPWARPAPPVRSRRRSTGPAAPPGCPSLAACLRKRCPGGVRGSLSPASALRTPPRDTVRVGAALSPGARPGARLSVVTPFTPEGWISFSSRVSGRSVFPCPRSVI